MDADLSKYFDSIPHSELIKSVARRIVDGLAPGNNDPWPDVRDALNAFLFGWSRYFSYGDASDAGNRHVRFDERGWETERRRMAQATAPILDSTESARIVPHS